MEAILEQKKEELQESKKKGFTLVELIVVIVIIAILAAIAVPALTGYITRAQDQGIEIEAKTALTAAQSYANDVFAKVVNPAPTDEVPYQNAINKLTGSTTLGQKVTGITFEGTGADYSTGGVIKTLTFTSNGKTITYSSATGAWS